MVLPVGRLSVGSWGSRSRTSGLGGFANADTGRGGRRSETALIVDDYQPAEAGIRGREETPR